jgi:hypothetical protein
MGRLDKLTSLLLPWEPDTLQVVAGLGSICCGDMAKRIMPMTAPEFILIVFTVTNSVRVVAYLPQIRKIAGDNSGAVAVSNATWLLFGVSHLSTMTYAAVVLNDLYMTVLFGANLLCCLIIIILTVYKRRQFARQFHVMQPFIAVPQPLVKTMSLLDQWRREERMRQSLGAQGREEAHSTDPLQGCPLDRTGHSAAEAHRMQ